jgi:hypothetical protein
MYEIEAVAVPSKSETSGKGRNEKYPFSKLAVGQSFFVPNTDSPNGDAVLTMKRNAYSVEKRFDEKKDVRRFNVIPAEVGEVKGARVGRTE